MGSLNHEALAKALTHISTAEAVNARLVKFGLPAMEDADAAALALVKASGAKSQGDATVLVLNTAGTIAAEELTRILAQAFPKDKVGARHGPHYLSLARTGKLAGVEMTNIPHRARKAKATIVVAPNVTEVVTAGPELADPVVVPEDPHAGLRVELAELTQKELAARAKKAGVKAIGKKEDVIERIVAAS